MFAKECGDLHGREDSLGFPLQMDNLGQREFARLIKAADVRIIKFHGLRHTAATLLFQAGAPAKVVHEPLGHRRIEVTLAIYAYAPALNAAGGGRNVRRDSPRDPNEGLSCILYLGRVL